MKNQLHSLEVCFESPQAFEHEYATNIANGGIFLATERALEVRQKVSVRVKLAYLGKGIDLPGEVVHVVGPELAARGATPGVAVQFEARAAELRELFEPMIEETAIEQGKEAELDGTDSEDEPDDRRGARRSRTRLRARVECPGCEIIEGRTRDLSISGVLVSIGSSPPLDIGEPVIVTITNPETGLEREILGKVARHVTGAGGVVRAIGVQFYLPDADRESVEQFLRDLQAAEHSRHLGGIQGAIAELGLINLIQTFGIAAGEGTLDVMRGPEEGFVAFENGNLRAAGIGGTTGVKALARMLSWSDGSFEFHARIDPEIPDDGARPLDGALLEAMRLMDECGDVDREKFAPDALLDVDAAAREAAEDLTKLDEAILDLAASGMNLQRILDIVPETDSEIYLAIWTMTEREIVSVRNPIA